MMIVMYWPWHFLDSMNPPHQYTILADFIMLPLLVIHWYIATAMPECTLAIVPHGGYDRGKCGSLKENIWLAYLDKTHGRD